MALSIGIVGLPNVGKSTLFNALTRAGALAANYPFATIDPNVGVVAVPDPRLDVLAEMFASARRVPASVSFVDIAGLVRGASQGQGLGNRFLAHIREADAICQVVRVFADSDVVHVEGRVDPLEDIATVNTELILADLETVQRRLDRFEREARMRPELRGRVEAVRAVQEALDQGRLAGAASGLDRESLADLQLLTAKPFIYVFNVDETGAEPGVMDKVISAVSPAPVVVLSAKLEVELADLEPEDAAELLAEAGFSEAGLPRLAAVGFETLGLQTFLTAGPKESRAWTIRRGATAVEAAGTIHTDFAKGFVKAEVVSYADLVAAGSLSAARAAGRVRMEGRDYQMADGDVVEFRFAN
ncbi:MAG: redox-regulated ATPase YchF [Mycobacteriales bacterium]